MAKRQQFIITGTVRLSDGSPVESAIARAFDKDFRSEQRLGEATTSAAGLYTITYTAEQFRRAENERAGLINGEPRLPPETYPSQPKNNLK